MIHNDYRTSSRDSIIRIEHKPTGEVVQVQQRRNESQFQTRDRALAILRGRLAVRDE